MAKNKTTSDTAPMRPMQFRLLTIGAAGMGSFLLGTWGLKALIHHKIAYLSPDVLVAIISGLCALAASIAAMAFFAGVEESEDFVRQETLYDKLTKLPTRTHMMVLIAEAIEQVTRSGKPVFLIDIDIDRFKHINDAIGYSQGDELIRVFAERLARGMAPGVELGRIGAGEFAALVPMEHFSIAGVEQLIGRLMEPYQLRTHMQSVNLSVGIMTLPKDGRDPVKLLRKSNLALQHARASGAGN